MRIQIDRDLCQCHGVCTGDAPEVFTFDDDGELLVLEPNPPEALKAQVETALKFCPTGAISLVND